MTFGSVTIPLVLGLVLFNAYPSGAQDGPKFGSNSAISAMQSYSPNSEHILVGISTGRKTEQAGFGYSHKLARWSNLVLNYEGWLLPLYVESDPTYIAASVPDPNGGAPTIFPFPVPDRPIWVGQILGYEEQIVVPGVPNTLVPITGISGPRQLTYAAGALPVGLRFTGLTRHRIQPTFVVNLGALYATRNIPVDYTSSFNFLAQGGPGVEAFVTKRQSVRVEYMYEHLSNANLGYANVGVDNLALRVSFNRYR